MITENQLKDATKETIKTLNDCNIRTIMATGDNTLTAISVAKNCGILQDNQFVYYGDVEKGQLIWRRAETMKDVIIGVGALVESFALNDTCVTVNDRCINVPWDNEVDSDKFGVALNGQTLTFLKENINEYECVLLKVLFKAQVYARMSPDAKAVLIELLQDYIKIPVGMCGDGANDCIALKQGDIGISLSEAEASIAAPFTSKV
jgi:cation-transporting ATPase 13A2